MSAAAKRTRASPTPFALVGAAIAALGYRPIPVMPNSKSPGHLTQGLWKEMPAWQEFRDTPPGPMHIHHWGLWDDANVGVILGNEVTPGWEVGALDFDTDDHMMLELMQSAVPESPVQKRGQRGYTAFYQFPSGTKGRRFKRNLATVCEILTGNGTRQTVIPPSIHPGTGQPYVWITRETLATLAPTNLPRVTEEMLDRFIDTVESFADVREAAGPPYVSGEEGSPHNLVNTAALHRLSDWVPQLGLAKLTPTTEGFKAIPKWRANRKGWSDDQRKPSLGFSASGIRDFSADTPHSPLDIVMMSNGWDLDYAYQWLAPRVGMWHEDDGEWAEAQVAGRPANDDVLDEAEPQTETAFGDDAPQDAPPHDPDTGEIRGEKPATTNEVPPAAAPEITPEPLTHVPGLVGELTDWIVATSRQPNRVLALGAAVTVLGTLMGGRTAGPTGSGTHLYVTALAPSGLGKDHALRQIRRLLSAANAGDLVGPGSFMSQSATTDTLKEQPCCVCPMDEVGAFFAKLSDPRASSHEKGVSSILRQAWGASFEVMQIAKYAGKPAAEVTNPALSIYGVSTPGEFFAALRSKDVANGFLNRFLMIRTDAVVKDREPMADKFAVPADLRDALASFRIAALENTPRDLASPFSEGPARRLEWADDDARAEHTRLKDMVGVERQDEDVSPFFGRTVEMAIRLATIRAAGRRDDNVVTASDLRWGGDVAMLSARQMVEAANEHMAENEFEATCNTIARFVTKQGGWVKHWQIAKATRAVKPRDLDDALSGMVAQRRLAEKDAPKSTGAGRKSERPLYRMCKSKP